MRKPIKQKKELKPDTKYNSVKLERFINYLMLDGKKSIARKLMYDTLDEIGKKEKDKDAIAVFEDALRNAGPLMELRSRRVGGANYQIPREVDSNRRVMLAIRWIIVAIRKKSGRPTYQKLAEEIIAASKNEGAAVTRRENTHKMAEANRAFAHLGW